MRRLTVLLLLASVTACGPDPGESFFPLDPGLRWDYEVITTDARGQRRESVLTMRNMWHAEFDGETVTVRADNNGQQYLDVRRENTILRVARKPVAAQKPVADQPPRVILPLPATVGDTWHAQTRAYLLTQISPSLRSFHPRETLRMDFRTAATGVDVQVPAGQFRNCLRVDGAGEIQVFSDARVGYEAVPVLQTEWYCPGIGLVRLKREEKLDSEQAVIIGGALDMRLREFGTD